MSLRDCFEQAVTACVEQGIRFAVAGGFAADLYRSEPRMTMDVDLAIVADDGEARARQLLTGLGYRAAVARKADLAGGPLFAIKAKNRVAGYRLQVTGCRLQVEGCRLKVAG